MLPDGSQGLHIGKRRNRLFPDAPTGRGVKHLRELRKAVLEGYHASIAFVIQMDGVSEVRPNKETDPEFAVALREAEEAGVKVLFLCSHVEPDSLVVVQALGKDNFCIHGEGIQEYPQRSVQAPSRKGNAHRSE